MTIKQRIIFIISLLIGFLMAAIVAGLVIMKQNNQSFHQIYLDRIIPLKDLKIIADEYAVNIVDTNHKLRNENLTFEQASGNIQQAQQVIEETWNKYMATTLTEQESALAQNAQTLMKKADESIEGLKSAIASRDMVAVEGYSIEQLYPAIDPISDAITQLIDLQLEIAGQLNDANEEAYQTTFTWAIIVALLMFVIAALLSYRTLRAILRPMNELMDVSQNVVKNGDFSKRIHVYHQDEIGRASMAFNQLLDQTKATFDGANATVAAIADGDFSKRMDGDFVGEMLALKNGINASAESVEFMMNELDSIMNALQNGHLEAKMDERVAEAFRNKVEGALSNTANIINQINRVMHAVASGDYSHRVQASASGSFDELKQSINSSVDSLGTVMQEISRILTLIANGDLTENMSGHYPGELANIQQNLNNAINNLDRIVNQVNGATHIVLSASEEVSKGALDLSQRVQQQAAAVEQTSATMEEMNSTVQNNTKNAIEASNLSESVQQKTERGAEVMKQTIDAMNSIENSSQRINDIVTLIDSIAFQTNLLALNAAVEAARAGDHGRGFAVVAGEVRGLAQKSADAARDIKNLINESNELVQQGSQLTGESGDMLAEIRESITHVHEMIEMIARSSEEQAKGIEQVHTAISDIDAATQQNAALVEETSAATESMSDQAQTLSSEMAFFKTGSTMLTKPVQKTAHPKALAAPSAAKDASDHDWSDF